MLFVFPGSAGSQALCVKAEGDAPLKTKLLLQLSRPPCLKTRRTRANARYCGHVLLQAVLASCLKSKCCNKLHFPAVFRAVEMVILRLSSPQAPAVSRYQPLFLPFPQLLVLRQETSRLFLHGAAAKCQGAGVAGAGCQLCTGGAGMRTVSTDRKASLADG